VKEERSAARLSGAAGGGKVRGVERWATFDCYGTLVDWNGGIRRELARIFGEDDADEKLAEYHQLEPVVELEGPELAYREVMARVLERLGAPADERDALGQSLPDWGVFPEVPGALEQARARSWRLCILSNTDRDFLDASMAAIGVPFDRSIVASEIGSYKPAHGHWRTFEKQVGRLPDAHVAASLFHDVAPTTELGVPCIWINRLREDADGYEPARELPTLAELAEALDELAPA
jgi:2-haloacid dehalogenase